MIEKLIGVLIPPAAREEVLGDLRERCGDGARLLREAARVIPYVVASRIRRTTDAVVVLMQGLTLYTCFVLAALWMARPLLYTDWGFARLAIAPCIVLATVILADAYADPKKRPPLRAMAAPVLGMALAFAAQPVPRPLMIWGGLIGTLLVVMMRLAIPPLADRRQTARVPAYWQKLDLVSLKMDFGGARLMIAAAILLLLLISRWFRL